MPAGDRVAGRGDAGADFAESHAAQALGICDGADASSKRLSCRRAIRAKRYLAFSFALPCSGGFEARFRLKRVFEKQQAV
jgi:hypothetical protein